MTPKITFTKIKQIANEVLKNRFELLNEPFIRSEMENLVADQERKIILDSLGLERSWGRELSVKWNGGFRSNMKILSDEYLRPIAEKLLHEVFDTYKIELNENEKASLRKVYREEYMETAKKVIEDLAREKAYADAPTLFENFLKQEEEKEMEQGEK